MTPSVDEQLKNLPDMLMLAIRVPERRDVGIGEALIQDTFLLCPGWTSEQRVIYIEKNPLAIVVDL